MFSSHIWKMMSYHIWKLCWYPQLLYYYPEGTIDQTKHSQNHHKDPRPLNKEWSYRIHLRTSKLQNHTFSEKRVYQYWSRTNVHPQKSSLSQQQQGTDMHESQYGSRTNHTPSEELSFTTTTRNGHARGQLPYLQHQIMPITQRRLPNHV